MRRFVTTFAIAAATAFACVDSASGAEDDEPTEGNDSGWQTLDRVDPITDLARTVIWLDKVVVWCQPSSRFVWRHLRIIVGTDVPVRRKSAYAEPYFEYRFDRTKGQVVVASDVGAPRPIGMPLRGYEELALDAVGSRSGISLCPGIGAHCAKGFVQRLYAADSLLYRIETVQGTDTRTVNLTQGRSVLRRVMDECRVKPKT